MHKESDFQSRHFTALLFLSVTHIKINKPCFIDNLHINKALRFLKGASEGSTHMLLKRATSF